MFITHPVIRVSPLLSCLALLSARSAIGAYGADLLLGWTELDLSKLDPTGDN